MTQPNDPRPRLVEVPIGPLKVDDIVIRLDGDKYRVGQITFIRGDGAPDESVVSIYRLATDPAPVDAMERLERWLNMSCGRLVTIDVFKNMRKEIVYSACVSLHEREIEIVGRFREFAPTLAAAVHAALDAAGAAK